MPKKTYVPPSVVDNTVDSIDAQYDALEWMLKRALRLTRKSRVVWDGVKCDIEAGGTIDQATCEAGAPLFNLMHINTHKADVAAHLIHHNLSTHIGEDVNEGPKCWPP